MYKAYKKKHINNPYSALDSTKIRLGARIFRFARVQMKIGIN